MNPALPAISPPDAWAVEAARLPLTFAQVREDPRIDLELARKLPAAATVVMIASGGDTAACLARRPLARLHLVDVNPAQLALTRCKLDLAATESADAAAAWLGHAAMPAEIRKEKILRRLDGLGLPEDVFGDPDEVAAAGPDQSGRYERCFAELRVALKPVRAELDAVLNAREGLETAAAAAPEALLVRALSAAFRKVMSLPNLVGLFGEGATRNPQQSFASHFLERARVALGRPDAHSNPFLHSIFSVDFPLRFRADWLCGGVCNGSALEVETVRHCAPMTCALDTMTECSADMIHLSNILDWLSPAEADSVLQSARRVLKPGGRVIVRQLNSTLDIASLGGGIRWNLREGARLEAADRSFFYPGIFAGRRL